MFIPVRSTFRFVLQFRIMKFKLFLLQVLALRYTTILYGFLSKHEPLLPEM